MVYEVTNYKPNTECKFIHKRKNMEYCEQFVTLDTETSHNHDKENLVGWIYQWAFKFNGDIVIGRKPSDLCKALKILCDSLKTGNSEGKKVICYIHNLSYDFQYLKHYLVQTFGECKKFLAINTHRILSVEFDQVIFKCSYILANRSLEKWASDLNCTHQKRVGLVDYSIIRTQQEDLTDDDWTYQIEDIETQEECILKQMEMYADNICTIPLTSTGYVRRTARHNSEKDNKNRQQFQKIALNEITYSFCRQAFSGGLTHGNRFLADEVIEDNIRHRDFTSHYPTQQVCEYFPIGKFGLETRNCSIEELKDIMKDYCCLIEFSFDKAVLKDKRITFPYMQESKCRLGKISSQHIISDNGRVLKIEGTTILYTTELDMKWLLEQYTFENLLIGDVYCAKKGRLPAFMIDTVNHFFHGKSHFKLLEKKETNPEKKLEYALSLMKAKNGLNGIYGMSATDIIRDTITMDFDTGEWMTDKADNIPELLEKYYNGRNSFLSYQWGVWTTAHARNQLMHFIVDIVGYENSIYCDTDSLFYISTPEIEQRIEQENTRLKALCEKNKWYVEVDGQKVYYNNFGDENENITKFKFLHAKCYAYIEDETLHCTIAGVSQRKMVSCENGKPKYVTREQELGDIDNLKVGKVFTTCGGVLCSYVESKPYHYDWNGHLQECSSSAVLLDNTKTLHDTDDYYESEIIYQFSMTGEQ